MALLDPGTEIIVILYSVEFITWSVQIQLIGLGQGLQ